MTEEPSSFLLWDLTKLNVVDRGPKAAQLGVGDEKQELDLPQVWLNTYNSSPGYLF